MDTTVKCSKCFAHSEMTEYTEYLAEGGDYVPVADWGQDHWSTFAYLETRAVDGKGIIDNLKMRCNARLHREFMQKGPFGMIHDGAKYPTLLAGGVKLEPHDDWSCLEDMVAAGLVKAFYRRKSYTEAFGHSEAKMEFTNTGLAVAAALRKHKARGGNFRDFRYDGMAV